VPTDRYAPSQAECKARANRPRSAAVTVPSTKETVVEDRPIPDLDPARFGEIVGHGRAAQFADRLSRASSLLSGHTVWHVNSTATGGGVAELLDSVLGYLPGAGIRARWSVIDGSDDFFVVTKRIHHLLHGEPGDGGALTDRERAVYEGSLAADAAEIGTLLSAGDVVVLHDPQTLGLAPALCASDVTLVWCCHVGADAANDYTRAAWQFLLPYARMTAAQIFSRSAYEWDVLDSSCAAVVPPCIDPFTAKNQDLDPTTVQSILAAAGVVPADTVAAPRFTRRDSSTAQVRSRAELTEVAAIPSGARIVTQISRWDPLKDHLGVLAGFARHVVDRTDAHLLLAGPAPDAVEDDPEGGPVLRELLDSWSDLGQEAKTRVHIACLPMADAEENAAIVNAIQRSADVIVQKSLAEGFGLTVAEAMWKRRPVVGAHVGGIQDQIEDGASGRLIDPTDQAAFGDAVVELLTDGGLAARLGSAAHDRVVEHYLPPRYVTSLLDLVESVRA
jgi:trehalose synthase